MRSSFLLIVLQLARSFLSSPSSASVRPPHMAAMIHAQMKHSASKIDAAIKDETEDLVAASGCSNFGKIIHEVL